MTSRIHPAPLLRFALLADAGATGALGLLMTAAAGPLSAWLSLPKPLLLGAGAFCLAWAVVVGLAARSAAPSRAGLRAIIALNLLWAVDSIVLLATGWVTPSELGLAFVLAQAVAVLAFVGLQAAGLGRSGPAAA